MTRINPMSEIKAIAETCRRKCLPANARLLWRVLFDCANDRQKRNPAANTYDWPDGFFPVSNEELKTYSALEKRALLEARNVLKDTGAIDFIPGENNRRPAKYKIHYLTAGRYGYAPAYDTAEAPAAGTAEEPLPGTEDAPIYKDIDTEKNRGIKDDEEDHVIVSPRVHARAEEELEEDDPITDRAERSLLARKSFKFFIGRDPYPAEVDRLVLGSWFLKMKPDMIPIALRRAAGAGAGSPVSYSLGVLQEWRNNEVRQPHQVEEYHVDYLRDNDKFAYACCDTDGENPGLAGHRAKLERRRRENIAAGLIEPDREEPEEE